MSASYYPTAMFYNCVPWRQLGSCSVTRPFLSLQRVWLARLNWDMVIKAFDVTTELMSDQVVTVDIRVPNLEWACRTWLCFLSYINSRLLAWGPNTHVERELAAPSGAWVEDATLQWARVGPQVHRWFTHRRHHFKPLLGYQLGSRPC